MNKNNCCFISSNVKGIKSSGTRIKVFEYLKQKINQNGFIFMQETHSSIDASKKCDDNGRILILETKIFDEIFLLINLYNANLECDQLTTFSTLLKLLEEIDDISNKKIILGGDFNLFLDRNLKQSVVILL